MLFAIFRLLGIIFYSHIKIAINHSIKSHWSFISSFHHWDNPLVSLTQLFFQFQLKRLPFLWLLKHTHIVSYPEILIKTRYPSIFRWQNARHSCFFLLFLLLLVKDTRINEVLYVHWKGWWFPHSESFLLFLNEFFQIALILDVFIDFCVFWCYFCRCEFVVLLFL